MTRRSSENRTGDHVRRWEAQQGAYIRNRDQRFAEMARTVAGLCSGLDRPPRVLDLASGPGSLGRAVLGAVPGARVVMADKDPALLALASDLHRDDSRVEVVAIDLADPGWTAAPVLDEPFDAVVSTTALHWLRPEDLVRVYFELSGMLRSGGVLLNGDHLHYDRNAEPVLRELALRDDAEQQRVEFSAGAETWDDWWSALAADPAYADVVRERERVWGDGLHEAPPPVTLGFHIEALRSAGFDQAGTVWQVLDDYVVYGIR